MIFRRNEQLQTQINSVEKTNKEFRDMHTDQNAQEKISDLVPGLTEDDIKPDTETYAIEIDPEKNPKACEARMLSLHQVQQLFNVLLKRSDV